MGSSLLGLVIMGGLMPEHERLGIVLFCILLVVTVTALGMLHHRVLGHYQCQQCHKELPRHKDSSRPREYLYYCKDCDIVWKPGLQEGD